MKQQCISNFDPMRQKSVHAHPVPAAALACSTRHTQWLQWQVRTQQLSAQQPQLERVRSHRRPERTLTVAAASSQGLQDINATRQPARKRQKQARHTHKQEQQLATVGQSSNQAVTTSSKNSSNSSHFKQCGISYARLMPFPETADSCQQQLCDVLHIKPVEAQLLLVSSQHIPTLDRQQLTANWQQLQQLLPVPQPMLVQALLRLPDLLLHPQHIIHTRLQDAADGLQIPLPQLLNRPAAELQLVPQLHYQLLLLSQQELLQKLSDLQEMLGLAPQQLQHQGSNKQQQQQQRRQLQQRRQRRQVVQLVLGEPRLLTVQQVHLISTVEALEQVCAWPLARLLPGLQSKPRLLVTPADALYAAAANLQQLLRLSEQGLALALRRSPGALLVPAGQLSDLLQQLAAGLGAPVEVAADILLQEPDVLMRKAGAVTAVLDALRSTFKLGSDELLQVVEFDPSVLCYSPGDLADSTSKFKQAASKYKAWAIEYKHLMSQPVNVARALRIEPLRLARLTYLHRAHKAATISLKAAVSMSGRQFVLLYPGYQDWLAQEYSAGGVPKQYRLEYKERGEDEDDGDD